ncbi:MAG: Hpt domain-containing protein [Planctomycetota bacterium]|nr:Hpt domain-containing protein [Planctomycetota bacterium]
MSSEAGDAVPPVDMDWLEECNDGDQEAMKAMVALFFSRAEPQLKDLEEAIAAQDVAAVRRVSHACAGSSGTCGMKALEKSWRTLEEMAKQGTLENAASVAAKVREDITRTSAFLSEKGLL